MTTSCATRFEDLLDIDDETRPWILDFVPRFRTLLDDLTQPSDDALRARARAPGPVAPADGAPHRPPARRPPRLERRPRRGAPSPHGRAGMQMVWRYIMSVHTGTVDRVLPALAAVLEDEEQRQDMATIAEQLIERGEKRGIEKGIQKGIEKGIEKGERGLLRRLLQRRFGALPAETVERLDRATPGELERWADRVLTAATLAEVLEGQP